MEASALNSIRFRRGGVRVLGEDEDGSLLIVRGRRIARFVDGRLEPSSLQDGGRTRRRRLLRDRDGGLWVATLNRGLAHVHGGGPIGSPKGTVFRDSVRDLFEDREGNIWVATLSGLDRFRDFSIPTWTQKEGLTTPLVWSVLGARDGSIWLGSARPRQMAQRRLRDSDVTAGYSMGWARILCSRIIAAHLGVDQPRLRLSAK